MNHQLCLKSIDHDLQAGMREIVAAFPARFSDAALCQVSFQRSAALAKGGAQVTVSNSAVTVEWGQPVDAFRAVGRLLDQVESFREEPSFHTRGIMLDMSRNAVATPATVRALLRHLALMGINMVMLYTEDTYEVEAEPFFGYLRGRYTQAELKGLDDYAFSLGIEMIPCIQTLAHLEQILQWPAYQEISDTKTVLLAAEDKTYKFLARIIAAASAPFRSRRIHIGMDEAHGIGTGEYKQRHGEVRPFDILNQHLKLVRELCAAHDLQPMIWSDMYFRMGSATHGYYDLAADIPADVIAEIPAGVGLVYWDYYHTDPEFYRSMIKLHRRLGSEPLVASGIWTWNRFWTAYPFSMTTQKACLQGCRAEGIGEVFATLWGDDGAECDIYSSLPGLQYFAEHAYAESVSPEILASRFAASCGTDLAPWITAGALDTPPGIDDPETTISNCSKFLLWEDPCLPVMDGIIPEAEGQVHYAELAKTLAAAASTGGDLAKHLAFPAAIAKAVSLKINLRSNLHNAYLAKDHAVLRQLCDQQLRPLLAAVEELWRCHRGIWMTQNKPFGWEVIERRYGGLLARLRTLEERLQAYLAGELEQLAEIEVALQQPFAQEKGHPRSRGYLAVTTPSMRK